jgi:hypothetical protein
MQHLLVRLTALVRISSNKLGENIAATVLQEELQVSSVFFVPHAAGGIGPGARIF